MDREKLLEAIGEVDEDVLYFKYHLKNIFWALVMGVLTMITCLYIAERHLGIQGFIEYEYGATGRVIGWSLNRSFQPGLWFRWICLIGLPLLFARKVRWRYTWVNLLLFFALYFPIRMIAKPWPYMFYLSDSSNGIINIPWIVLPFMMTFHFWGVQSLVYLAYNTVSWILKSYKKDSENV